MQNISQSDGNLKQSSFRHPFVFVFLVISIIMTAVLSAVYAENTVLATNYVPIVCQKIEAHWRPPSGYFGQPLVISFRVYRNGSISNLSCKTANDPKYVNWQAAMSAVRSSLPFPRPAENFFQKNKQFSEVSIDLAGFYYRSSASKNRSVPNQNMPNQSLPSWSDRLKK